MRTKSSKRCVVLNATYEPLTLISSRRALILWMEDKAVVLQEYDEVIRSPSVEFNLPAVIALKKYVKGRQVYTTPAILTQRNLFVRDKWTCQYCGRSRGKLKGHEVLTRDHVKPRSRGGKDVWTNVVTSCSTCNNKKGQFLLSEMDGMQIMKVPRKPTVFEIFAKGKMRMIEWDVYEQFGDSLYGSAGSYGNID